MKKFNATVLSVAKFFNIVAGFGIVVAVALIVINIILRVIFKNPILGTYEFVGFLSSVIIGGGIAYCAILNGHIAVDFIIEKLNIRFQRIIDITISIVLFGLTILLTWKMFLYAANFIKNGEVSPTTQTPFYIFPCFVALCFLILSLVFIMKASMPITTKEENGVNLNEF